MQKRIISFILALILFLSTGIEVLAAGVTPVASSEPEKIEMVKLGEKDGKVIMGLSKKPKTRKFLKSTFRSYSGNATIQSTEVSTRKQQVNLTLNKYTFNVEEDTNNTFKLKDLSVDVELVVGDGIGSANYSGSTTISGTNGSTATIVMDVPASFTEDELMDSFRVVIPSADKYEIRASYDGGSTDGVNNVINISFGIYELPNLETKVDYVVSNGRTLVDGFLPQVTPKVILNLDTDGTETHELTLPKTSTTLTHKEALTELVGIDPENPNLDPFELNFIGDNQSFTLANQIKGQDQNYYINLGREGEPEYYKIVSSTYDLRTGGYVKLQKIETNETIIPWTPDEQEPTKGNDGYPIPSDYIKVVFKTEDENKGKVQVGDKTGPTINAKVKPGTNLAISTIIKVNPESGYGFLKWEPSLSSNLLEEATYTAKFMDSGKEVTENEPIPEGWVRVKFMAGEGTEGIKNEKGEFVSSLFRAYPSGTSLVTEGTGKNVFPEVQVPLDTDKTLVKWAPDNYKVSENNKEFTAAVTAKYTDKDIIPWIPGTDEKPTDDGEGNLIPKEYVEVTFKAAEDKDGAMGTVTVGDKAGGTVKAMVNPEKTLADKVIATANVGYGFTKWTPSLGMPIANQTYIANFIKAGDEVGKDDKIPTDWVRAIFEAGKGIKSLTKADNSTALNIYKAYPINSKVEFPNANVDTSSGYAEKIKWMDDQGKTVDTYNYKITADSKFTVSTSMYSDETIIPYNSGESVPTEDYNGKPIDGTKYTIVNFQTQDNLGIVKINKNLTSLPSNEEDNYIMGENVAALVKKGATYGDVKNFISAEANDKADYTFWTWSLLGENAGKTVYNNLVAGHEFNTSAPYDTVVARFVNDGKDITGEDLDNNPLPKDFFTVNVEKSYGIKDNELFGKTYTVKSGSKLAQGKFPTLDENILTDSTNYQNPKWDVDNPWDQVITGNTTFTAQASTVVKVNVEIGKEPRHGEQVVTGKLTTKATDADLSDAIIIIRDKDNKIIGRTFVDENGDFVVGTRPLVAGEKLNIEVKLIDGQKASQVPPITVKLNPDRLSQLLPIAEEQYKNFKDKENAFIKERLENLNKAIENAKTLVEQDGKPTGQDTADDQKKIDDAVTALEEALKALTANIPPTINGPLSHEIYVGQSLTIPELKDVVRVTDADGLIDLVDMDLDQGNGNQKIAVKITKDGENTDITTATANVGEYTVTYTAKDKAGAEVTHEMKLTVKARENISLEVEKDPSKMSYGITTTDGTAKLGLAGMKVNVIDNLGDKKEVKLTDENLKLTINGREVTDKANFDLKLEDDVKFIEVQYQELTAKTNNVLRVFPDLNNNGMDDRTEGFNEEKISKLEVIKQPQLDYVAKNKDEAETAFKLNLEGMIVRMTDTAGKEKLAIVKEGKFCDYDDQTKLITYLSTDKEHGTKLNPASSETDKGDNGAKIRVYASAQVEAYTDALRVFYDANGDGEPDYKEDQKTLAPTATARNIGENSIKTTVEGFAEPGALVTVKYVDTENNPKTVTVKADSKTGAYTAEITPKLAEGTVVNVTAKLGEMAESDSTTTKVFEDADNDGIPDNKQDFDITKATKIEFVNEPNLTYLVASADTEVTFDGKDGNGRDIFVKLSYKNGDKELGKIYTLAELKDKMNVTITPSLGMIDKITNDSHSLIDNKLSVALKNGEQADTTATFAIKVDADGNGVADEDEKNVIPVEEENTTPPDGFVRVILEKTEGVNFKDNAITIYDVRKDANIRYADIYNEVSATTMEDYENIQWYNADQVVKAEGVITADVTLTAKATKKAPTEQIVEVTNPDENPPQGYMRVALEKGEGVNFTAEKYQNADKAYFNVLIDAGVRYYDVYRKVEAKVAESYEDLTWYKKVSQADDTLILGADPIIERNTVTLIAKATKQGPTDSIIEVTETNSAVPKGYVRVSIVKGEGVTDVTGILAYDVKSDKSVRFADIMDKIGTTDDAKTKVTIDEAKYTDTLKFNLDRAAYPLEATELVVSATEKPAPATPEVDPIKQGDEKVVVKAPEDGDTITITLPGGETVTVTKDQDGWKAPDGNILNPDQNGKLQIPVNKDNVTEGDVIVKVTDSESGKATDTFKTIEQVVVPEVRIGVKITSAFSDNEFLVFRTTVGNCSVKITVRDKNGNSQVFDAKTSFSGVGTLELDKPLQSGDSILIEATKDGYLDGKVTKRLR